MTITIDEARLLYAFVSEPLRSKLAEQYIKQIQSQENVKLIPSWSTWTETEADTWYQTNVRDPYAAATTLSAMKAVIGTIITVQWATIRIVLALRNHTWPNL